MRSTKDIQQEIKTVKTSERKHDKEETVVDTSKYYKLICRHCDDDGYIQYSVKLPIDSCNIHPPDEDGFEILPHRNEGWVTIRHKCIRCGGLKYSVYYSAEWELQEMNVK